MTAMPKPLPTSLPVRHVDVGGCLQATIERRADGSTLLRSTESLGAYPERLTDHLLGWAETTPQHCFVARREPSPNGDGPWREVSYAQMLQRVQGVAQSLVDLGLSVERPVAILSDNDIEHLTLALAAMWVGVPYVPISSAYSLVSQDYGKLRHILATVTTGLEFASGPAFAKAIAATAPADAAVVLTKVTKVTQVTQVTDGQLEVGASRYFESLLAATPAPRWKWPTTAMCWRPAQSHSMARRPNWPAIRA